MKETFFVSGDIHYFRIYPGGMRRRLELMKAFGITVLQTYVPWNLHEPKKGKFVWDGLCDLEGFLSLADEMGFHVFLRPSPYICSEWELGGIPSWVLADGAILRTHDEKFLRCVADYYKVLCAKFRPYLKTNGGPIAAVAIENEYGSFGNDRQYLEALCNLLSENGINVPFYTTDGHLNTDLFYGTIPNVWAGVNYRIESKEAIESLKKNQKNKPALIGEYWSGRAIHWGEPFEHRVIEDVANGFKEALENDGHLSFYMFAGGTNFGFMNGANFGHSFSVPRDTPARYIPHTTTYDEDALINEQGLPTKKYHACRKVLWEFLGKPMPPMPKQNYRAQIIEPISLDQSCSLWDTVDYGNAKRSLLPLTMEQMGQDYGYLLYRTHLIGCGERMSLSIKDLHDRADVYIDRKYYGTIMRDRENSIEFYIPRNKTVTIEILCENMGRINYGIKMNEQKGICGPVIVKTRHWIQLFDWETLSVPLKDLNCDTKPFIPAKGPVILKGAFNAEPGIDTFLDLRNMKKGFVLVNGFNLGRYWNVGPQYTLYVPGELLKEQNTIEIFEHYGATSYKKIKTRKTAILK
ncbi:MAG: beta-galactosidase [Clostridia bacterium]|nr:beta-galactosidase [Clostridia bacterium]